MTIVVDVANVMGSRPDGWWRDRAAAAARLHAQVARMAASGQAILPDGTGPSEETGPPGFVMVFEGAANAAVARLRSGERAAASPPRSGEERAAASPPRSGEERAAASPPRSGEVRVVQARGSGDDAIVAVVRELPGRRVVVTADRELRSRCVAAGAAILNPGWLLAQLRD